jgi:hypothetical protein
VGFKTELDTSLSFKCKSGDGRSDIYIKSPLIFDPAIIMEILYKELKELQYYLIMLVSIVCFNSSSLVNGSVG